MSLKKLKYYLSPLLIAFLIFLSNFLNTQLFGSEIINFVVWFILSLFIFGIGWFTNNTLGWVHGGKIVFAVIVAMAILSSLLISFFNDYFLTENLLFENVILYSLRIIMLGVMAFFGMSISEIFTKQKEIENLKKLDNENEILEVKRKSENIINEANLKAEKIIFEANKKASELFSKK
ncbi:MAG: hypothetical protein IPH62_12550 [Ignavibacteriae bacterium]|nr:hypothetical protein [Ignavibacteriota bacterium]